MATNSAIIVPPPGDPAHATGTNDIRDIKAPVAIPNPWFWVWVAATVCVLAASALAGWLWWQKKRRLVPQVPVIPPHIRARQKLQGALSLLHDPRLFCILVSDTLRVYLEERFSFHAPDRTTEEFMTELHATRLLTPDQKQTLGEFLQRCDLVKFARYEPTEMELRDLLECALRLIDETQFEALQTTPLSGPPPVPANA